MAMTKCKECGKEISSKAAACPSCGSPGPASKKNGGCGTLIVVLGIAFGVIYFMNSIMSGSGSSSAPEAPPVPDAKCKLDLKCWGERHSIDAEVRCAKAVESLAKYQMKWTASLLEPKFSQFAWSNQQSATLRYLGDKASFQNGFGAWKKTSYWCIYDPAVRRVLDAGAD